MDQKAHMYVSVNKPHQTGKYRANKLCHIDFSFFFFSPMYILAHSSQVRDRPIFFFPEVACQIIKSFWLFFLLFLAHLGEEVDGF